MKQESHSPSSSSSSSSGVLTQAAGHVSPGRMDAEKPACTYLS